MAGRGLGAEPAARQVPKTEHHGAKESRLVPIFPELLPYRTESRERAAEGALHVLARYCDGKVNLRTQSERIIRKAGLKPWPKLFQNMRATPATELASEFPAHVAAAWLGHSRQIAEKRYWQVTDADYELAVAGGAESGAPAAQNAAQPGEQSAWG